MLPKSAHEWTPEALARLSPAERICTRRRSQRIAGDPSYRELATLRYRDGAVRARDAQFPKGTCSTSSGQMSRRDNCRAVSWLVPPENFSDHPCAPWYGAWYVAEVLDILTHNPEVWKKTIFILTYDENDGYFDHVPPFVAPDPDNPESGKTSPGIDAEMEYLTLAQDQARVSGGGAARGGPIGLGYRVPLIVASPWSRGGYVCSQVFDHTSVLQFLENLLSRQDGESDQRDEYQRVAAGRLRRPLFGISAGNLRAGQTDVSRAGCGHRRHSQGPVQEAAIRLSEAGGIRDRGVSTRPAGALWMPRQEKGVRPSLALPYELYADGA